jgi:hypothetical protein
MDRWHRSAPVVPIDPSGYSGAADGHVPLPPGSPGADAGHFRATVRGQQGPGRSNPTPVPSGGAQAWAPARAGHRSYEGAPRSDCRPEGGAWPRTGGPCADRAPGVSMDNGQRPDPINWSKGESLVGGVRLKAWEFRHFFDPIHEPSFPSIQSSICPRWRWCNHCSSSTPAGRASAHGSAGTSGRVAGEHRHNQVNCVGAGEGDSRCPRAAPAGLGQVDSEKATARAHRRNRHCISVK